MSKLFYLCFSILPFTLFAQSPDSLFIINIGDSVIVEIVEQDSLEDGTIDTSGIGLYTLQTRHESIQLWDTVPEVAQRPLGSSAIEEIDITDTFASGGTYLIRGKVERFVEGNSLANQNLSELGWSSLLYVVVKTDDTRKLRILRIRFGQ